MTKLMKLSVIALLTGALGLVGCGDDGGTTGGSGGAGATGGAGGAACESTCGVGNELPAGSSTASVPFTCSIMGIPLTLEMNLAGVSTAAIVAGDNTYELTFQTIITAETADLIAAFGGESAPITGANGTVTPIAGSTDMTTASIVLDPVPCEVCITAGTAATITLPTIESTWNLDNGTEQVLELTDVTVMLEAAGLALELSNIGDAPACFWGASPDNSATMPADPPSLSFAIGAGGAGGAP